MSKTVPTVCQVEGCSYSTKITFASIDQVRKHLVLSHDYFELQKTALKFGIIKSEKEYRSYSWLIRKIADSCLVEGSVSCV